MALQIEVPIEVACMAVVTLAGSLVVEGRGDTVVALAGSIVVKGRGDTTESTGFAFSLALSLHAVPYGVACGNTVSTCKVDTVAVAEAEGAGSKEHCRSGTEANAAGKYPFAEAVGAFILKGRHPLAFRSFGYGLHRLEKYILDGLRLRL